jgi:hypothetical protein
MNTLQQKAKTTSERRDFSSLYSNKLWIPLTRMIPFKVLDLKLLHESPEFN